MLSKPSVGAAAAVSMAAADLMRLQNLEHAPLHQIHILGNRVCTGPIYLHARLLQLHQCTGSDAADNNRVDSSPAERLDRAAGAMLMVEITIDDFGYRLYFRIDHNKHRG